MDARTPPPASRPGTVLSLPPAGWEAPIPLHQVDLPAFPVHALPGWLRDFVEAEATATQTPPDLAAQLALAVGGYALSKKVVVRVKDGHEEPLNLYTVTALPPANRKSAVFRDVIAPLEEAEREAVERLAPEVAQSQSKQRVAEEALRRAEVQAAKAHSSEIDADMETLTQQLLALKTRAMPRFVVEDCSPERLATLLAEQGGRIAVMAPEGDVFDLMAGRYSATGTANFGVYLKGHAGDTIRVDRVGRPPDFVPYPAITVGLAVQPEVIRGLFQKPGFRGRGLLARFLYAMPVSLLGRREVDAPAVPESIREAYRRGVRALLDLPAIRDDQGEFVSHVLEFEPDALELLRAFETWLEPELGDLGELGHMADWAGKLVGAIVRIVGILRAAEDPTIPVSGRLWIDRSQLERAIEIGRYLIAHARAAYGEMGGDPVIGEAAHVLAWIRDQGEESFTKRNLFSALKGRFKRVVDIEPALGLLIDYLYIRPRAVEPVQGPGRRPSPVYEVNPEVLAHNPHNPHNWSAGTPSPRVAGVGS